MSELDRKILEVFKLLTEFEKAITLETLKQRSPVQETYAFLGRIS